MGNVETSFKRHRIIYLDILRIIACYFVIFNHTGSQGFFLFSKLAPDDYFYWIYLFISIFDKVAVPTFLAISGALILQEPDEPLWNTYKNRVLRILITLTVFSFGYYYCFHLIGTKKQIDLATFFIKLYSSAFWNSTFWYLYLYLAFLLTMPFIKSMVQNLKNTYFYYMIFLAVFFNGISPIVCYFGNYQNFNPVMIPCWIFNSVVVFPSVGYFLHNRIKNVDLKTVLFAWGINICTIGISCYATYFNAVQTNVCTEESSQAFHNSFAMINMIALFLLIKYICERVQFSDIFKNATTSIAECTYGVYLFHLYFLRLPYLKQLKNTLLAKYGVNQMIMILLYCLVVFVLG